METSFAEVLLLIAFGIVVYKALRPVRDRLEAVVLRILRGSTKSRRGEKPIIDVTPGKKS